MKSLEVFSWTEASIAMTTSVYDTIVISRTPLLARYQPSQGKVRLTALVNYIVPDADHNEWSSYFESALNQAVESKSGLVLIHQCKHGAAQIEQLQNDIWKRINDETGQPLFVMNLEERLCHLVSPSGVVVVGSTIRVIGSGLDIYYNDELLPPPTFQEIYKRTITVWGEENHAKLARLRVGIAGLGSVGSIVAQCLARMGMERFVLIDFDEVQEHNLDRLLGATRNDIGSLKVDVAENQIKAAATTSNLDVVKSYSGITEEEGYRMALDCDVIFSCVDRPWPRYSLNVIAYNHLVPVIDGGIQVRFDKQTLKFEGVDWQAQTIGPQKVCLECLGAYTSANVDKERDGLLDDPTYIAGLPETHEFKRNENVFPFSANLASLEVLQLVELVTGIADVRYYGTQRYRYNQGYISVTNDTNCDSYCYFLHGVASGESVYPPPYGYDHAAKAARERQVAS